MVRRPDRLQVLGVAVLAFALLAAIGPFLWQIDSSQMVLSERLQAPSFEHPFGTDQFGRDVLARFLEGARLSAVFGASTVLLAGSIGTVLGTAAGLLRGMTDLIIGRLLDAILAFPALILAMAIAIALKPSAFSAGVAVVVVGVPWYARRVRSEVLSLRTRPFIEAEYVIGASQSHIILRHLLPSVLGGVVAQASLGIGYAVLTLAALGFLGLGVQPPTPEWGSMITEGRRYLLAGNWWLSIFPGIGIVSLVALSFSTGDALSDRLSIHGASKF